MRRLLLVAAITAAFSGLASADPIGPNCTSCNGGIYTLAYSGTALPDFDLLHETYRITLTIDTSGVTGVVPTAAAIDAVAIKVSASTFASSLFQAPSGVANWTEVDGGINAGGCSGSGGGFECAYWSASGIGAAIGGTLTWVFDITVANGALNTTSMGSHVKARYVNASDAKVGDLVSEDITLQVSDDCVGCSDDPVPEPSTYAMIGIAAVALGLWKRKLS